SIHGAVTDAVSNQPLAGATVVVTRADSGLTLTGVADLTTASDGTFQLSGLAPGSYLLSATAAGHAVGMQTVTLSGGAPVTLALAAQGTLEGTITDAVTGQPVNGANVELINNTSSTNASSTTDATGKYSFANLTPGSYTLVVIAAQYEAFVLGNVSVAT